MNKIQRRIIAIRFKLVWATRTIEYKNIPDMIQEVQDYLTKHNLFVGGGDDLFETATNITWLAFVDR